MDSLSFMAIRSKFFFVIVTGHLSFCGTGMVQIFFLNSMEGVMQVGPIDIFAYGKGILLLIKKLEAEFPDATQPWYTDNA